MKRKGDLLQAIWDALGSATRVTSIVYSPYTHLVPSEVDEMKYLVPPGVPIVPTQNTSMQDTADSRDHPFRHLLAAIFVSRYTGIRRLRIEALSPMCIGTEFNLGMLDFPEELFFADAERLLPPASARFVRNMRMVPEDTHFEAAEHLFQNLETCELHLSEAQPFGEDKIRGLNNLKKLLLSAEKLKHLALHVTRPDQDFADDAEDEEDEEDKEDAEEPPLAFASLGLQNAWKNLKTLSFGGINISIVDILDLMQRHESSLTSLSIQQCGLESGTWAEVVDQVLISTRITHFVLNFVAEETLAMADGTILETGEMEEWIYEGYLDVSDPTKRAFVRTTIVQGYNMLTRIGGHKPRKDVGIF